MKKSVITLLIFLIMIISVSAVSAADDASDLGASDDATISVANTDTAVAADKDVKNFTELNQLITADTQVGELTLSSDYKYNGTGDVGTITFNHNIVIDGNGSTINGTGRAIPLDSTLSIFKNDNSAYDVTLKNMKIVGFYGTAIYNVGTLKLVNVTFDDPVGDNTYGVVSNETSTLNVTDCSFDFINAIKLDKNAKLVSPSVVNIEATIDNTEWRKIKYTATVFDDNNNRVIFNSVPTGSNMTINNVQKDTHIDTRGFYGEDNATRFGENVVNLTCSALDKATVNTATVNVIPKGVAPVIDFTYTGDPANPKWNDTVVLTVTVQNYTDPTGEVSGEFTPTGNITFTIQGDKKEPVALVNGSANYTIENIPVGTCSIYIDYSGDASFNAAYNIPKSITVDPINPTITVNVTNSTIGEQVITIELPSDANGVVNVTIPGYVELNNQPLTDGKITLNTNLPANDTDAYTITVKYDPINSPNYLPTEATESFWASRFISDVIIEVENTTYGSEVSFTIKVDKGIKNATVKVGNIYNEVVNFTNGVAIVDDLGVIAAGVYTINVTTYENNEYQACNNTTKFNVAAANPDIVITVGDYVLFEDVNVTVTVTNAKADGVIDLTVNGVSITSTAVPLDENGTAKLTIPANNIQVGDNEIVAIFTPNAGNANYTTNQTSEIINVVALTPTIIVNVTRVNINQSAKVKIIVNGSAVPGSPKPTGSVTLLVGSRIVGSGTLTGGETTITILSDEIPALGTYYINATYKPDDNEKNYTQTTTDFSVEVTKWDVEEVIDVRDFNVTEDEVIINVTAGVADPVQPAFVDNFTVTIKDANNNIINETSIALVIGQKTPIAYNTTELGPGDFTVEISYAGDDYHYANATDPVKFSIKKVIENLTVVVDNVIYPNQAVAVVNASVDGKYNVTVNNKNYTVTVENGIGNVTLDLLAPKVDVYDVTVVSFMDDYATLTNTTTFKVEQGTINATITVADVVYGNNVTAVITNANVDGNYSIMDVDGKTILANVTVTNGKGSVSFAINKPVGQYTFNLTAPENDNYTNSKAYVNETTFNVTNATIEVTVTIADVKYPNQAVVIVNASADGEYYVFVNGVKYSTPVKVVDGTGNITLDKYAPDTYEVNVTAEIANYNPVNVSKTFNVNKGDLIFNITAPIYVYGQNVEITLNTNVEGKNASQGLGYEIYLDGVNVTNINGGTYNLGKLAAGKYEVKVVAKANDAGFENYTVNDDNTTFNRTTVVVNTAEISLTISVNSSSNLSYPGPVKLDIATNVTGNYTVTVGSFTKDVYVTAGTIETVDVYNLPVSINEYTATVTSKVGNYTETTNTTTFTVTPGTIDATINIENVPFATAPIINITSTNANGTFTVTVNGKNYAVEVVNGNGIKAIEDVLYVNTYTAEWGAMIDNYNQFIGTPKDFKVIPAPVNLTVDFTTVEYPNRVVATVSANASGIYSFDVNGVEYNVTIQTKVGEMKSESIELELLGANKYTTQVTRVDSNGNFTYPSVEANVTVNKGVAQISVTVIPDTYKVLQNVTIRVSVPKGTGYINLTDSLLGQLPDEPLNENGTLVYTINKVKGVGTHVIYAELHDDANFTNNISQTSFVVTKIPTGLDISDNNPVFESDAILYINITGLVVDAIPGGVITINGYGLEQASNETITYNLGKLTGGEHILNITYTGDEDHYASSNIIYTLTVRTYTPTVNATATGNTYPGNATVKFNTTRSGKFSIVTIDADGHIVQTKTVNATNDTENVVEIAGLAAGDYTFNVTFVSDGNYTSVTNTTNKITIEDATATFEVYVNDVKYPNNAEVALIADKDGFYTIEVYDSEGTLVENYSGALVANVFAYVDLVLLDAGDYTVNATYESENYTAADVSENFTVDKGTPIITIIVNETTFPEKAVLNITCSADGNYTVEIDHEEIANGTFTAGEPVFITAGLLNADYHEVLVTYDGNENYDPKTKYDIFTINQGTPEIFLYVDNKEILENSTLYILIPYGNGNITVNGKSMELNYSDIYHVGFAKYNIGILKAETYDLTVIYYGNENLTSGDNFTSFTVNKLPSNLKVIVENTTYGVDSHAFITIDNPDEINLDLYVDGEYAKTIKVVNGTSDGYLADLNAGEHNFTVAYAGSDVYEAETVTADFTIAKADVTILIDGDDVTYPGDVVVTVESDVPGYYQVSIGLDSKYVYLDANEEQNVTFKGLDAGDYTVYVERQEDTNYNYAIEWVEITVEKGEVSMTIVPTSDVVDYPDVVVVTVTSDVAGSYLVYADPDTEPKNITLEANKPVDVSFYDLEVGLHRMAIVYLGSDNYEFDIELANVTVIKAPVEIEIFAPDVVYPNPVIVTVTVNVDGLFNVTVGEITKSVYLDAYTPTNVGFNNLSGGWYDIIVSCPETENYNATTETSYVIVHRNVNIEVSAPDVDFPEDVVVTVTADVTGTYTVKVGSVSYDVDLEANVAKNVTFKGLNAGTYDVTVTYPESEVYDETVVTTDVTVNKGTPEILLVVDTTTILEDANLTIVIPYATGNVVLVNGKPVVLVDGLATYNIGTLKAETYDFTVVYSGDDNLNFGTASDSFTVEKLASNLDVFVDNSTYGVPAFSYISLNNTDYVTVQLWLDDEFINFVNIIGGRQTKYVTDVAAGEHTIKVVYDGSDVYNADEKSYNFTIAKAEVTITVDAANVTYPEDVVVSVMSDVAGTYGVTIGDTTKSVVLEANVAKNVTFAGLAAGTHEIAAFFTGNENYTSSVEYADAIVNKVENTPVYIYATSPIASENATIYVYVPTDATGNVTVKYGNGVYTAEIVDGEAVVSVPTSTIPGTDNASVSYSGDDNYEGATDEVEVTVLPNGYVIAENIRRGVNSPYDYYATLVDLEGNPIAGVELTFTILGQTFKATTNASGIATVSAGLSVVNGSDTVYDVTVTNPYSFKNVTATTTIVPRLIVCSGDLTADYLTNPAYVVQAIGDDGNPVGAGVVVRIVFAGFYYDLETNATGHVKRTIGLAPGMYAVRGEYMGYITNQTVFVVKQVMKVTSGTLKKTAKSYTLKATLKSSDGIAIAGETVKLTFNGKTYTVKTNSKGVASYTIKSSVISKLKAGQTYELKAKYENDIVKGKIKVVSK